MRPLQKREDRRDAPYAAVMDRLGLNSPQRPAEGDHAGSAAGPGTRYLRRMTEDDHVAIALAALGAWSDALTRREAAQLLDLWKHRDMLSPAEYDAVLGQYAD